MADVLGKSFSHTYAGAEFLTELFYVPQEEVPAISNI